MSEFYVESGVNTSPTRPVLRYHGGKWRMAPWIISHFPEHRIYVEPFGGAASVLMRKSRSRIEVYNDLDGEIVNVFRVLRHPLLAMQLEVALRLTPYARAEFMASYDQATDMVEQARRTIVRQMMAFGTSARRKGRTGFRAKIYDTRHNTGLTDWYGYPDQILAFVGRLTGVLIEERDALELIRQHDGPNTLFYVDPPYVQSTRTSIRCEGDTERAYAVEMTDAQHIALADQLHRVKGMVVLSGYHSHLYNDLYGGWVTQSREAIVDHGGRRTEVLWFNPAAAAKRKQPTLIEVTA